MNDTTDHWTQVARQIGAHSMVVGAHQVGVISIEVEAQQGAAIIQHSTHHSRLPLWHYHIASDQVQAHMNMHQKRLACT